MRTVFFAALICASCADHTAITRAESNGRSETIGRLCEPLPEHAYDCVVGWPASVSRARRSLVMESANALWSHAVGVRAYASCRDHRRDEGLTATVIVLLVDNSLGTTEELAERLPLSVRWTEACTNEIDDCASYVARADGDRLVLTRRTLRDADGSTNVARLACSAVEDGAFEALARVDDDDAIVREERVTDGGLAITTRRPRGRGETQREHRSWTELELDARDREERIARLERTLTRESPADVETFDVSDAAALDAEIEARLAALEDHRSEAALHDLARLAERGLVVHPSWRELGYIAIVRYIDADDADGASRVLASMGRVGSDDAMLDRLALAVAVASADADRVAPFVRSAEPDLVATEVTAISHALASQPLVPETRNMAHLPSALRAFALAARAARVRFARRSAVDVPLAGAAWSIEPFLSSAATGLAFCGSSPGPVDGWTTMSASRGSPMAAAALASCVAFVAEVSSSYEVGAIVPPDETSSVVIERGDALVGVRGVRSGAALHVAESTVDLVHADLARAVREVQAPLASFGQRVFPAPSFDLALPSDRVGSALSAADTLDGVECTAHDGGVRCALDSGVSVDRLADVAIAMFRTGD